VCAAAGNFLAPAEELSPNAVRTVMEIDALGTWNACHAARDALFEAGRARASAEAAAARPPGGADRSGCGSAGTLPPPSPGIVTISMTLHWGASFWQAHASAAKAAVDALQRSLALEWGYRGVRVNGVAPGPVANTAGMARLDPDGRADARDARPVDSDPWSPSRLARRAARDPIPLGRQGDAADVAMAVVYLSSEAAAWVSGASLAVDGANWLWKPPVVAWPHRGTSDAGSARAKL